MPRPSRTIEARQRLTDFYVEHGVLPTVAGVAALMGYRSTASAHHTIRRLVTEGFLAQEERGGRLLPGPAFDRRRSPAAPDLPEPLAQALRELLGTGRSITTVTVASGSLLDAGILPGDVLLISPDSLDDPSGPVVWRRGAKLQLGSVGAESPGWRRLGYLLLQYRLYPRP